MSEKVEGQYGDWNDLKVGDEIRVTITGYVTEVGSNYADIETEYGNELTIDGDWDVEVLD